MKPFVCKVQSWDATPRINMHEDKKNKEDEEKNLLLTGKSPARPKRSFGQSSETEMKHVLDLEICKRKVSEK